MNKIIKHIFKYYKEYSQLSFFGILIAYFIHVVEFSYHKKNNSELVTKIHNALSKCVINNDTMGNILFNTRGNEYFIRNDGHNQDRNALVKKCFVTIWNVIHFSLHFIFAFCYPCCWFGILLTTTIFEIGECVFADCHDLTDLVYNFSGVFLGVTLRNALF